VELNWSWGSVTQWWEDGCGGVGVPENGGKGEKRRGRRRARGRSPRAGRVGDRRPWRRGGAGGGPRRRTCSGAGGTSRRDEEEGGRSVGRGSSLVRTSGHSLVRCRSFANRAGPRSDSM
jgi:hypothetical protein